MYPRNAASPERIAIGAVVQISDGAVQTSGVSIKVKPQGTTASAGGGTTSYEEGIVEYLPTQAETNYTSFEVIAYKTGCVPIAQTIVTTASATPGTVLLAPVTHTSAVVPTVSTLTGHTAQTGDAFARLGAPAGASVSADVAAVKSDSAAILVDTGTTLDARIPAALVGGRMDATVDATGMESGATGAIRDAILARTTASGVVGSGSTTANVVASSVAVGATTSLSADAWKGRVIIFNSDTTTAALRGQAAVIVSHTSGSTPTFTLATGAWTTAPLTTDTFTVV
ncbi:MAG: hypothetical protein KA020_11590 [Planctomycetes bacterium]|nr:hypothetical protein [Planctomycetota bacterium]